MTDVRPNSIDAPNVNSAVPGRIATVSRLAKGVLIAVGLALLAPLAGIPLQSKEALEQFHNGTLAPWPSSELFWSDPAGYLRDINVWLADRAYPIITTTYLSHNLLYWVFGVSPQPNISVSHDGFIFLTGSDADSVYDLIARSCLGTGSEEAIRLQSAVDAISRFADEHRYPIDVLIVPTIPTLYGDRLPRSVPSVYRTACAGRASGRSPLAGIHSLRTKTRFLYPLAEMRAHRDDPAFYPNGNFHPDGLSAKVVRDAYLRDLGVTDTVHEQVQLASGASELLMDHGIRAQFPIYQVENGGVQTDQATGDELRSSLDRFYPNPPTPHAYVNRGAPVPQSVLMISDSFGYNEGISFAAAFSRVVQVSMPGHDIVGLLEEISRLTPYDRVALVFNDSNIGNVIHIGQALGSALPAPSR